MTKIRRQNVPTSNFLKKKKDMYVFELNFYKVCKEITIKIQKCLTWPFFKKDFYLCI